ncbi:Uncharacterised protein [uncultured Clostridium sp.]|nr:Uncharacterised protein [uncultured Clostridium sp.]
MDGSFFYVQALPGSNGSNVCAPLRSSQSNVPRTFCDVSCSQRDRRKSHPMDGSFSMFEPCQVRTVRMSTLRCPYSRCQFPECGSCPSDRWQYGQRSSRQTHARYMESIQEFPYTVLQRRETSPLKNACRKQAGYFLCIASAPSLGQNKERIVAIKKLLCNHFT